MPDIGVRPVSGKNLVLLDMPRCPQSHCNTQDNQPCTSSQQHFLWFARSTDQDDKGNAKELAEAFPVVSDIVKKSL
jgi:hypothetical protein